MKRYETYKDSGAEWIGEIPENWASTSLKYFAKTFGRIGYRGYTVNDIVIEGEGAISLSPSNINNQKLVFEKRTFISWDKYEESPEIKIYEGDVVLVKTASVGKVTIIDNLKGYKATINPQLVVFKDIEIDRIYFYYVLISDVIQKLIESETNGGVVGTLTQQSINNYKFPLPSPQEQTQIAAYLDYKTGLIDSIIAQKEDLIKKLKEQRQAIINEAVTKGLNPDVKLKDSGIDWLGEIPEHWEVVKLSYYINVVGGSTPSSSVPEYWDGEVNWVTTDDLGKLKTKNIETTRRKITEMGLNNCSASLLPEDTVIMSSRAPIGHLGILRIEGCTNQGCKGLVPFKDNILSEFLYYFLLSSKKELESLGTGSTFMEISATKLKDFKILLPSKEEQKEVLNHIESGLSIIDKSLYLTTESIQKLKEYRQSIISEAVTGKIDVRNWQAPKS
jgi:type I restriction enzyme, S subunit